MRRYGCFLIVISILGLAAAPGARAASFVVNSTADAVDVMPGDGICATDAATCTLRAAIQETNALSGADTITVPAGTYTIAIAGAGEEAAATGDLDITGNLTITGAVGGETIVSGGGLDRVFDVLAPAVVTLSRLTIQSGNASTPDAPGGGIRNAGALTLSTMAIRGNTAAGDGGGMANRTGGSAQLTNVTVTGNGAGARGGGIANDTGGTLQLTSVTVSGNSALQGGGLDNFGNADVVNTIVANSLTGGTCAGAVVNSLGHNLDSGTTCLFTQMGDLQNKDPKLAPIFDTGTTFVLPLQTGSPAIDAGDNLNCPSADQRGQLRPADGNGDGMYICDIGAYEVAGAVLPTPTVTPTGTATNTPSPPATTNTPTPTRTPVGGSISLSQVLAHPGEQVVFTATLSTKGASIASTQNDIAFDSTNIPIAVLPNAVPDCTVNPQLAKEATSFTFRPPGCSGATCTSVHAAVLSTMNTNAIPDGSVLYTCKVNVAPNAPANEYPLTIAEVILQSPNGQPLPNPVGSNGAIVVLVPTPTRTPGAGDCCQCSQPLACGPGTNGCGACAVVFGATCDGVSGQCIPFTATPTGTATPTPSQTPVVTATGTTTPTPPNTRTPTATSSPTPTASSTPTPVPETGTPAATPTATPSASSTSTPSSTSTASTTTPTETTTATGVSTPTPTGTPSGTSTASPTPSETGIVTATVTDTATATATGTRTEGLTPTPSATASDTATPTASETVTPTAVSTPNATTTETPSPTASASPIPRVCAGDCDHSGEVSITDLVVMVNVALESAPVSNCTAGDINADGQITVDEILVAVGDSLDGCPAP